MCADTLCPRTEPPTVTKEQLLGAPRVTAVAGAGQLWTCDRNQSRSRGQDGSTVNLKEARARDPA